MPQLGGKTSERCDAPSDRCNYLIYKGYFLFVYKKVAMICPFFEKTDIFLSGFDLSRVIILQP